MNNNSQKIGFIIQQKREELGMSLSELARQSDVSRGHLYSVEKGESGLTEEKLQRVAKALGLLVSQLLGEIEIEGLSDLPIELSDSLRKFAEDENLPSADVVMLSKLNFRGKIPQTDTEWRILYSVIKNTLE